MGKKDSRRKYISKVIKKKQEASKKRRLEQGKQKRKQLRSKMTDADTIFKAAKKAERRGFLKKSLDFYKHANLVDEQPAYLSNIIRINFQMDQFDEVCKVSFKYYYNRIGWHRIEKYSLESLKFSCDC